MTATSEADSRWKELRVRERLVVFGFIGFFPVAGGLALFVSRFTSAEWAVAAAPVAWMAFVAVSWIRFLFWPCPRCGEHFHTKWYGLASLTRGRRCVHCGLARYEQV